MPPTRVPTTCLVILCTGTKRGADPAAARFKWGYFLVMAGRTDSDDPKAKGSRRAAFAAWMACRSITEGVLWIQTAVSSSTINKKAVRRMGTTRWWLPFRHQ